MTARLGWGDVCLGSDIYTGYMRIMYATFSVCFKFLTLLVFEISGTQKSGN